MDKKKKQGKIEINSFIFKGDYRRDYREEEDYLLTSISIVVLISGPYDIWILSANCSVKVCFPGANLSSVLV
jgi:hypothetical protein